MALIGSQIKVANCGIRGQFGAAIADNRRVMHGPGHACHTAYLRRNLTRPVAGRSLALFH
ncbi:MAG: hypothetical protein AAF889_12470 [Cyanobacteria bacterium P01_D01_bin.73]